ncbi:MAG: hypothetical protein JNJ54_05150 [Myxococcaceae bacterium]|nr:hypothetical protein [Myxococcaceae bacterium]
MSPLRLAVLSSLVLNAACAVTLKAPSTAPTAQRAVGDYGSNVMRFGEFQVKGVVEKSLTIGIAMLRGRAAVEARSVTFAVTRAGKPFTEITCGAAPDQPQLAFGGIRLTKARYTVSCTGRDFTLEMTGDAEKPLRGTVTWRGERFPVKTTFETVEKGNSPHLGFVVENAEGWLATSDIQGPTWIASDIRPEAREAVVLANFAWASRRNVVMEGASGGTHVLR